MSGLGRCRVSGLGLLGDWGAVKALSVAAAFFCPAPCARGLAGKEQARGWGCWSIVEVWEAPGREKLVLN